MTSRKPGPTSSWWSKQLKFPGTSPGPVIAGDFTFDRTASHAELLSGLAKVAQAAGAPFIAAAHPHLLCCDNLRETPAFCVPKSIVLQNTGCTPLIE